MKSELTNLGENKVKLSIEIPEKELAAEILETLKVLGKDVQMPGFRKGKIPPKILENHLGGGYVRERAIGQAIPKYCSEAIESHEVDAVLISEVEIKSGQESGSLGFDATVEVRPELDLTGYRGIKVTVPSIEPTPQEYDQIRKNFLKSFGELNEVNRSAKNGDYITLNLQTNYNGQAVEGLNISDYVYEIGENSPIEEMNKELLNAKVGDALEFNAKHPQEEGNMRMKVLIKKIQENKVPELTDDLVSEISEFTKVQELEESLKDQILTAKRSNIFNAVQQKVMDGLVNLISQPLPEGLLDIEMNSLKSRYAEAGNIPEDALRQEAVRSVKVDLGLRAVVKGENLTVAPDDLDAALANIELQLAEVNKKQKADKRLTVDPEGVHSQLLRQKAFEWLIENAELTDEANEPVSIDSIMPKSPEPEGSETLDKTESQDKLTKEAETENDH